MAKIKKIAVIGFGNIGTGVVRLLYDKGIAGLELVRVVDTDITRKRPVHFPGSREPQAAHRFQGSLCRRSLVDSRAWSGRYRRQEIQADLRHSQRHV